MVWVSENITALLGLLATLGLLLVTWIYTSATREMARTAAKAADDSQKATAAAERSAQAALDAARVAQSQIEVEFHGRLISLGNARGTEHVPTVEIRSVADAVVVSRVVIRRAFRKLPGETDALEDEGSVTNEDLVPAGETQLPRRVHKEERLHFTHSAMTVEEAEPLVRFILDVHYTFSEEGGAGGQRQVIVSMKDF
ncbi:hypothetical protein KMZ32_05985 [Phycicoccus sp. MAQZ13P-2]|uniref:hypothetical protein n=1 Tax=Phycicoccus mangrovi TaxID=2840470 RepID=UPI001C002D5E|nr:hypothetical protein [Phycicoccus mangrovi]MBT9273623.1 hypothetical protein [Phycicoccus mangrovi]